MPDNKLCFVIGPIGDEGSETRVHADWLLEGVIEPVVAEFPSFWVKRADRDPRPGLIDAQMINDLLHAELVIADLSFSNANAFYEIGIRHMAQKPIIHMQLKEQTPPFDVSLYRAIKFSRTQYRDLGAARIELAKAVKAILAEGYQVENPVTNARGRFKLEEHATPSQKVIFDQLVAFEQRLSRLEPPRELDTQLELAPRPGGRGTPHDPPLKVGERVWHQKFGKGNIMELDETKVTVSFPIGVKRIIDSFLERAND